MTKYQSFTEIPVWIKSHQLTLKIYHLTKKFPKEEVYSLTSQIKRSSSSIPANIAEGFSKNTTKDLMRFVYNARGSCSETLYHIILSKDLGYIVEAEFNDLYSECDNIGKQLSGWLNSLSKRL